MTLLRIALLLILIKNPSGSMESQTVFFEMITSDSNYIAEQYIPCNDAWVTIVSTAPPGDYERKLLFICGDIFGCSTHHCYVGESFEIDNSVETY